MNEDRALTSRILKGLYLTHHSICGYPEFLVLSRCSSICTPLPSLPCPPRPSCAAAGPLPALEQVRFTGQVLESVMARGMKSTTAVSSRNWFSTLPTLTTHPPHPRPTLTDLALAAYCGLSQDTHCSDSGTRVARKPRRHKSQHFSWLQGTQIWIHILNAFLLATVEPAISEVASHN